MPREETGSLVVRIGRRLAPLLLVVLVAVTLGRVARERWVSPTASDLATYVGSGRAIVDGADPRLPRVPDAHVEAKTGGGWLYPQAWLAPCAALGALPLLHAARVWLVLGLAAVGALVAAAWIPLRRRPWLGLFTVAVALAHLTPALRLGIFQGNVAPIEAALLAVGLAAAMGDHGRAGGLLTGVGASLKIGPAPLIALAAWASPSPRRTLLLGAAPLVVVALVELASPPPFSFLISAAYFLDHRGAVDPSSLALLRDLRDAGTLDGVLVPYGVLVAGVGLSTLAVLRGRAPSLARVALVWLAWLVILPRVQGYGWVHALVPLAWAWTRPLPAVVGIGTAAASAVTVAAYGPWWTALATWAALLMTLARSGGPPDRGV